MFFFLAAYVAVEAARDVLTDARPAADKSSRGRAKVL
jgi:hypothetical protein